MQMEMLVEGCSEESAAGGIPQTLPHASWKHLRFGAERKVKHGARIGGEIEFTLVKYTGNPQMPSSDGGGLVGRLQSCLC